MFTRLAAAAPARSTLSRIRDSQSRGNNTNICNYGKSPLRNLNKSRVSPRYFSTEVLETPLESGPSTSPASTVASVGHLELSKDTATGSSPATRRRLNTLEQKRLSPSDYLSLSGQHTISLEVDGAGSCDIHFAKQDGETIPFPPKATGFFYLYSNRKWPHAAYQIRFRCTRSDSKEDFKKGIDLYNPDGVPWNIPLYLIGITPSYAPIRQLLQRENLLSNELLQHIHNVYPSSWAEQPPFFVVHAIGERFVVPMKRKVYGMWTVGLNSVGQLKFHTTFLGPGPFKNREEHFDGPAHCCLRYNVTTKAFTIKILKMPKRIKGKRRDPKEGFVEDLVIEEWYGNPAAALALLLNRKEAALPKSITVDS